MSDGLDQPRLGIGEPEEERREDVWQDPDAVGEPAEEPEAGAPDAQAEPEPQAEAGPEPEPEEVPAEEDELPRLHEPQHAAGELDVPDGYGVIEGEPSGGRRAVGVAVARFNGELTNELLRRALDELERLGVGREAVTVIPVPGAFELPLAAMALAKTRRYSCIVALGAVIRGETPHFEYVASEAASGLQLAGLETGVPVAFGVLTTDDEEQARARLDKGAEAVRTALEMADVFAQLRAAAGQPS
ncbi:MAG TPA: 6,7-dimethyl-8-ribityllumazine synthase [Gaiellaceae bacterium]|nr:6,7-dimethyl-8-ribityllumazine synthase [Gaiellaceae bacterium]